MAFYSPLGALSRGAGGFTEGLKEADERNARQFEMMGLQALGRAFQPDQGPMPPMPGQPSTPAGPPPGAGPQQPPQQWPPVQGPPQPPQASGDMFGGMGGRPVEMGAPPMGGPTPPMQPPPGSPSGMPGPAPGPSPGAGAPPAGSPGSPPAGGMPQLDLQTLAQRIAAKNPNLPPQAMMAALMRAEPLLSAQGKMELARLGVQQRQQGLDLQRSGQTETERHHRALEGGGAAGGLMSPEAIAAAAERYRLTGQMPPNLGRGVQGRADMAAIQNKAAELDTAAGVKPEDRPKKWQEFKAEQIAIQRFMSGPQGNTVRSLGVVVDHLGTMRELALALQNNDLQAFNRIANAFAAQTGAAAPTNAATAAQIVGSEVIKSLGIAGAGTKEERQEAANAFAQARSPEQLVQAIDKVVRPLMLGQLKGMRRQFKVSTGLSPEKFDQLLGDEAREFFGGGEGAKGGDPGAAGFDRAAAKKAGYTDEEIDKFLKGK